MNYEQKLKIFHMMEDTLIKLQTCGENIIGYDENMKAYFSGYRNAIINISNILGLETKEIIHGVKELGWWSLEGKIEQLIGIESKNIDEIIDDTNSKIKEILGE